MTDCRGRPRCVRKAPKTTRLGLAGAMVVVVAGCVSEPSGGGGRPTCAIRANGAEFCAKFDEQSCIETCGCHPNYGRTINTRTEYTGYIGCVDDDRACTGILCQGYRSPATGICLDFEVGCGGSGWPWVGCDRRDDFTAGNCPLLDVEYLPGENLLAEP